MKGDGQLWLCYLVAFYSVTGLAFHNLPPWQIEIVLGVLPVWFAMKRIFFAAGTLTGFRRRMRARLQYVYTTTPEFEVVETTAALCFGWGFMTTSWGYIHGPNVGFWVMLAITTYLLELFGLKAEQYESHRDRKKDVRS
jgi:hypothetical protein